MKTTRTAQVLAVDDETVSRLVLKRMLETLGMDVVLASDVPDAIAKLESETFDLVVSDYQMPSGTGLAVAAVAKRAAIPFILLTGVGNEVDLDDDAEASVDVYLTKPVSTPDLTAAVARCGFGSPAAHADESEDDRIVAPSAADVERNRGLLEAIGVEVAMLDADGNVLATTAAYRSIFGYEKGFWESTNLGDLVHPDDVVTARESFRSLLAQPGHSEKARFRARHADGHWEVLESQCTNLLEHLGVGAFVVTTRSVTKEEDLREANREAAARAASQTEFVASVSHELRSPLQGILGVAQLLEPQVAGEAAELVTIIRNETERLRVVIDDLLDYAKIGQGAMPLVLGPTSVRVVIDDVVKIAAAGLSPGVTIDVAVATEVPAWVEVDGFRLQQILLNLVSNAVNHTQSGTIEIASSSSSDERLLFAVSDTGVGIKAEQIERLFEPFHQGESSGRSGGTGLGLSICHRLIGLMAGRLSVQSKPGQGSTFSFAIKAPTTSAPIESVHAEADSHEQRVERRALVIDDGQVNRMVIGRQLETLGFVVDTADGGALGAEMAIETNYQLIVADWHMPEVDGLEAIRRIRAYETTTGRHTPIISMTASAMPGDQEKCLAAGADDFLAKPATSAELHEVVARNPPADTGGQLDPESASTSGSASRMPTNLLSSEILEGLIAQLDDPQMVLVVVDTYLDDLTTRVDTITAALTSGDHEQASREAHTLKAPSMMLGATVLADLCQDVESRVATTASVERIEFLKQVAGQTHDLLERWATEQKESA